MTVLTEPVGGTDETTPEELLSRYESAVADVVESLGPAHVAAETDLDEEAIEAARTGHAADLDLREVAAVLALHEGAPDTDGVLAAVVEHLLLGMSSAMLTVDQVAAEVGGDLDPKEVQGKVEGRLPMTLAEYARLHHAIAGAA